MGNFRRSLCSNLFQGFSEGHQFPQAPQRHHIFLIAALTTAQISKGEKNTEFPKQFQIQEKQIPNMSGWKYPENWQKHPQNPYANLSFIGCATLM